MAIGRAVRGNRTFHAVTPAHTIGERLENTLIGQGHLALLPGRRPLLYPLVVVTIATARYPVSPPPPPCLITAGLAPLPRLEPDDLLALPVMGACRGYFDPPTGTIELRKGLTAFLADHVRHVPTGWVTAVRQHRRVTLLAVNEVNVAQNDWGRGMNRAVARGHVLGAHISADVAHPAATTNTNRALPELECR